MPSHYKTIAPEQLHGRRHETELLNPLVGTTMLELGNKVKGGTVYKDVFTALGMTHVSIDLNGKNGAHALDLRRPLGLGTFDMVTNFGTSEHVGPRSLAEQTACWRNMVEAMHIGSVLVSITPKAGAPLYRVHGAWYPKYEFFDQLAELNGLELERCYWDDGLIYARLRRVEDRPFAMPARGLFHNERWAANVDNIP